MATDPIERFGFSEGVHSDKIHRKESFGQNSGIRPDSYRDPGSGSALHLLLGILFCLCAACQSKSEDRINSPKFTQYYNQGEQLYLKHCSNCHQKNGSGLGRLYPPLNRSDYMTNNLDQVICLMRFGKSGQLAVNGIDFNQPMPGIPTLTDLEIAEIATYIYNSWEQKRGIVEVKDVSKILQGCNEGEN